MDKTEARIAQTLRQEREARGWSQAMVAERSGVAKATISKIEREEISPTAVTLVKLAGAFDLTLAGLLLRAEGAAGRLSRAADQPQWRDPETGYLRTQVFMQSTHPLELVEVELPQGQSVRLPEASYLRIRQLIWVRAGVLTLTEGTEVHELHPGDCLGFGPPSDVVFANNAPEPCRYVVCLTRI